MSLLKFGFTKKTVDCNTDGSRDMAQQLDKNDDEIEIHEIAHPAVTESTVSLCKSINHRNSK
jgi:hypothetical protein